MQDLVPVSMRDEILEIHIRNLWKLLLKMSKASSVTVPRARLHPIDSVEQSSRSTVAGVDVVHAFHVPLAARVVLVPQLHQDALYRLGLVYDRLGPDFEASDVGPRDVRLVHDVVDRRETQRVGVLSVARDGHPVLPEAHRVLS